ncbi:hypothetical protein E7V67_011410 [[Empedobacter] haloabium]|uniref:Uncharacterized protein n=1 Tax=[Empedobacter] haloabium TaxID=592317 RepID=A0ABZ1USF7_9BURK
MNSIETRNAAHRPEKQMARHHDDQEQYEAASADAFQLIFDRLVAEGIDADAAAMRADEEAEAAANGQVAAAEANALACRESRWADAHEFA